MSGTDIPSYQQFMLPVLKLIAVGETRIKSLLPQLQAEFQLTDEQMERLTPSGSKTYIYDRAYWACSYMLKAGFISRRARGAYVVSPRGREFLESNPTKLDNRILSESADFRFWKAVRNSNDDDRPDVSGIPAESSETPEDLKESAFAKLDSTLSEELLEHLLALTPARFEQLIVELLLAMGYGNGHAEMGRAIGKSGDGGIDGVVNEDKLGLDAVYIQAKKYKPEITVGRPALQAFIGSMTGESATKGVFVTTSGFSREAHDYVRRVQQRVVLIDGARLARLMIDHGVGVRVDKTYVLRSIDANFFDPI
ncbi:restriction endonuclease [Paracoccus xiamenensis]|uniref:restriction endonuclease n=1 Tax=Paracoccus xiamenensis TaxID=2714901 RepID=UPI00140B9635|nr:restriction endonuclease [Paracoccus xiamenensis]NHF73564.1 restriction endonuclease [Paracoccus xiamenensis]